MHSKFRLLVGSVLLFALPTFGQASPPSPEAMVAAPAAATAGSGTGAAKIEPSPTQRVCGAKETASQHGDGVYAVRYLSGEESPTPLVGFSWVKNIEQCPNPAPGTEIDPGRGGCEVMNWMVGKQQGNPDGKFPINPEKQGIAYCHIGDAVDAREFRKMGLEFAEEELGRPIAAVEFGYGLTVTFADLCEGSSDVKCQWPTPRASGAGSGSVEPK